MLVFDEMKVREDLVFNRDGEIIGFVDTGDINNKLMMLETRCADEQDDEVADHVLALMVCGIFFKLDYEFTQFPTKGKFMYLHS